MEYRTSNPEYGAQEGESARTTHAACPTPHAPRLPSHATCLGLFLLAFFLRLVFAAGYIGLAAPPEAEPEPDAPQYVELAVNLLERGEYVQTLNGRQYLAYRSPLWPLTIAAVRRLAGPSPAAVRLVTIVLGSLLPLLLYFIARRLGLTERAALAAAVYAACYPFFILYSSLHLTEALFITLLHATVLAALRLIQHPGDKDALAAGILVGLTSLTRPVVYPLPLLIALALVLRHGLRLPLLRPLFLLAISAVLVTAPWFVRNWLRLGAMIPGDTHGGNTFYGAHNPGLFQRPELAGSWYLPPQDQLPERYRYEPGNDGELMEDRRWWALGRQFIRDHPGAMPWLIWRRFVRFFSPWPSPPRYRQWVSLISYGPLLFLAPAGAWLLRRRWRDWLLVHLLILQLTLLSLLTVASVRMRNPLDGFLIILAAALVFSGRQRERTAT